VKLTPALLRAATGCQQAYADLYAQPLSEACEWHGINTPARMAAFLAQVGHESGSLRFTREIWGPTPAQQRYEGRADLGNTEPGDGLRYCGRGLIQLTGRANYIRIRDRMRGVFPDVPDFEDEPEQLERPRWACLSAAEYWAGAGLNALADKGDFEAITKRINGGLNGQADRLQRWERAKQALAVAADQPAAPELEPAAHTPAPEQEQKPMAPLIPVLLQGLAGTLFSIFAPLAREKVEQVLTRKGLPPGVGTQVMTAAVDAAKKITGMDDAVQATAAVLAKPELVQAVQADVLDTIDRMMPALSQANRWEQDAWAAEESSRAAAADRMRGDPHAEEIDTFLTRASVRLNAAVMIGVAVLMVVLVVAKADNTIISALGALLVGLATTHKDTLKTRYDHAYGSSRTSAAKDAVIGALSQRGKT
jgi:putative chitinase